MPDRRCCCVCPPQFRDDFNGPSGTNIGAGWEEVVGDWVISGDDDLQAPSATSNSLAIYTTPPWGRSASFRVQVETGPEVEDDVYRVVVNYVDANNYSYGQFIVSEPSGGISLWEVVGGAHTLLAADATGVEPDENGGITINVCFTERIFSVDIAGRAEHALWIIDGFVFRSKGYLAGVGADSTESNFDYFIWEMHRHSHVDCLPCRCNCSQTPLPMGVLITLTLTGGAVITDCADGTSTTLVYQQGLDTWEGTITFECEDCSSIGLGEHTIDLSLSCNRDDGTSAVDNFNLATDDAAGIFDLDTEEEQTSTGSNCTPLILTFGPVTISAQCEPETTPIVFTYTVTYLP